MTALWMVYAVLLAALLGVVAVAWEELARYRGWPGRWAWVGALMASVGLPLGLWLSSAGASVGASVRGWLAAPFGASEAVGTAAGEGEGGAALGTPEVVSAWVQETAGAREGVLGALDVPLLLAWLAGSLLLAGVVAVSALRLKRRARSWDRARIQGQSVLVSPDIGPAVLGVRHPRVVLPAWIFSLGRSGLELVLLHEREHMEKRDLWLLHMGLAALVLMPWNPALWWQLRRLRLAVEVDCDGRVLAHGVAPRRYGSVLLEVEDRLGGTALNALALGNPTSSLKRRFEMMAREDMWRRGWKVGLAGFVGLLALAVACEAPTPGVDEAQQPEVDADDLVMPEDVDDLAEQPTFTPHTVAPSVENQEEVQQALRDRYPSHLRDEGIEGEAILHIFIDEDATVENIVMDRETDHPELNEAAMEVAEVFEFSPALNREEQVPVWIQIPVRFEAEGH